MNQNNHDNDDILNDLYQSRKERIHPPTTIKSRIFSGLDRTPRKQSETNWFRWLSGVALAASTLLLVGLVSINQQNMHLKNPPAKIVEIHTIEEMPVSSSKRIMISYQKHANDYASKAEMLDNFHRKTMLLTHFDAGWELENCDETVMQVSTELVDRLSNNAQTTHDLPSGIWVDVYLDNNGHIRKIIQSQSAEHCV